MNLATRLAILAGAYAAAAGVAFAVTWAYIELTPGMDRTGGMSAFGDALFFLMVFGACSVAATVFFVVWRRRVSRAPAMPAARPRPR